MKTPKKTFKEVMQSATSENKTWNFSKGDTTLSFTLRVDTKKQMQDFIELLSSAHGTVAEELKKRFE